MLRVLWAESVSVGDSSVARRIRRWLETGTRAARKQPTPEVALAMLSVATDARTAASPMAVDVTTASTLAGFVRPDVRVNPCPPIAIIVDDVPIVPDADSTWSGPLWPGGFLFRRHSDGRVTFEARTIRDGNTSLLVRGERDFTESQWVAVRLTSGSATRSAFGAPVVACGDSSVQVSRQGHAVRETVADYVRSAVDRSTTLVPGKSKAARRQKSATQTTTR